MLSTFVSGVFLIWGIGLLVLGLILDFRNMDISYDALNNVVLYGIGLLILALYFQRARRD